LQPQFTPEGDKGTLILLEDSSFINRQLQQLKLASLGRLTASIAHEIRNPLGAISHAAQLLAESDDLPSPDRRLTDIILDHCKRVNTLIEDVLQLSRGGNAKPERMWLQEVLKRFTEDFAASERLSPEQLTLHLPELPAEIYVDPNHLNQVLWNLCKNAVIYGKKDNEPPQVRLEAGRLEDTGFPYLDVRDQGVGIPPDLAEEIFEPFYTSGVKGTGLGLFLSRELCEFNNATLIYQPGNAGACFRIVFSREH
jgi:two-component system sensor histidine kinase PilS (NtrC family)